ncbi:MAG TPA: hypothetical protein VFY29_12980 [Terriglobia bacterium]|nr:hypothetical protein [Terriglobia bacterium]
MRKTTYFRTTFRSTVAGRPWRWLIVTIVGIVCVLPVFAQTKAQNEAPSPEPPPIFTVDPGYRYNPKGRLDPFVNPVPPKPPANATTPQPGAPDTPGAPGAQSVTPPLPPEVLIPVSRPRGVKGLLLEDISVKGVIVARDPMMTMAIIQGPGNRTYNITRHDEVFNAIVKDIRMDGIVFSPIVRKDDSGVPLSVKEVRSDSVIYTKLPSKGRTEPSTRDVVRKLHPAPGEPK